MKSDEQIAKQYANAQFDRDPMRKARIHAKATAPKPVFRFKRAYAAAASLVLFAGFFAGISAEKLFSPKKAGALSCSVIESGKQDIIVTAQTKPSIEDHEGLSEDDCAEVSTKYLLARAAGQQSILLARVKDCPTASDPISSYDSKIIAAMEKEINAYSKEIFSDKDMAKLKVCTDKYHPKIEPFIIYKMAC